QRGRRCGPLRRTPADAHLGAREPRQRIALRAQELDVPTAARRPQDHTREWRGADDGDGTAQRVHRRGRGRVRRAARRHGAAVARGRTAHQRRRDDETCTRYAHHWTLTMWRPSVVGGAPPDAEASSMVCGPVCAPDNSKMDAVPARSVGTDTSKSPKVMARGTRG